MRQSTEEHRGASAAEFGTAAKEGAAFRRFPLHIGVIWAAATLRHHPFDVLPGILDVAGLAVHAVLRVDLQARVRAVLVAHDLVHARRAVALLGRIVLREIALDREVGVDELRYDRQIGGAACRGSGGWE